MEINAPLIHTTEDGIRIAYRVLGQGPPLLLLHGYPETGALWRRVATALQDRFRMIIPDLRGYGASDKPDSPPIGERSGEPEHAAYSKRAMAQDMASLMTALGYGEFDLAGHDRGARVAHRLTLDHPNRVRRLCIMDIVPTLHVYETADTAMATAYYHWFFLIQPADFPERLINADPVGWVKHHLSAWSKVPDPFEPEAADAYAASFRDPATVAATCEDYRAGASIDLDHDQKDFGRRKILCPTLVLWGDEGFVGRRYDVLSVWRDYAEDVKGHGVPGGHFVPEEAPKETVAALRTFFAG